MRNDLKIEEGGVECFFSSQVSMRVQFTSSVEHWVTGQNVGVCEYLECLSLADGLESDPGVCPADLQRGVVAEDVVAEFLQRGLGV